MITRHIFSTLLQRNESFSHTFSLEAFILEDCFSGPLNALRSFIFSRGREQVISAAWRLEDEARVL